MTKYRFKTKEEFVANNEWNFNGYPKGWNDTKLMNEFLGQDIPDVYNEQIETSTFFRFADNHWVFNPSNAILNIEKTQEELLEEIKLINKSLITKEKMNTKTSTKSVKKNPVGDKFVFMDKTVNILNVGFSTSKNVILYGPGE